MAIPDDGWRCIFGVFVDSLHISFRFFSSHDERVDSSWELVAK